MATTYHFTHAELTQLLTDTIAEYLTNNLIKSATVAGIIARLDASQDQAATDYLLMRGFAEGWEAAVTLAADASAEPFEANSKALS